MGGGSGIEFPRGRIFLVGVSGVVIMDSSRLPRLEYRRSPRIAWVCSLGPFGIVSVRGDIDGIVMGCGFGSLLPSEEYRRSPRIAWVRNFGPFGTDNALCGGGWLVGGWRVVAAAGWVEMNEALQESRISSRLPRLE